MGWQIETTKNRLKALKHNVRSVRLMKDYAGQYDCKECIHGITKSCTDNLTNGCQYFYNAKTGREFEQKALFN